MIYSQSDQLKDMSKFSNIRIVTSAQYYKQYEYWAMQHGFNTLHLYCTGKSDLRHPSDTFAEALELVLTDMDESQALILPSDTIPDHNVMDFITGSSGTELSIYKVNESSFTALLKLTKTAQVTLKRYLESTTDLNISYESVIRQLQSDCTWNCLEVSNCHILSWMSCKLTPEQYEYVWKHHVPDRQRISSQSTVNCPTIAEKVYARVGLIGNPSDGFFGKTIAALITQFWATVYLTPNDNPNDSTVSV
jgi:glucuronokinase